ncbi:MAG: RNA polymerase sigma factor [Ignavibacteriae bacterium]|nr:RNA polymerase sigma factor [Ignavibacteriota bacterium]MCB9215059.1 RNA polymerase sigma factor [Ignavibacteria bacterium]
MIDVNTRKRIEDKPTSLGNDELFSRFMEGDNVAFMEFFDRHTSRLGKYCRKMVGNEREAEDVLQDMWEKVLRRREERTPIPPNPVGILYWLARNLCLNRIRDRKEHASLDDLSEGMHPAAEQNAPSQMEELVLIALERLPLSQREPLILNAYSGYSFEEIAEMMEESVGTIRTRAWRGRRQLKRLLTALIELDENSEREASE